MEHILNLSLLSRVKVILILLFFPLILHAANLKALLLFGTEFQGQTEHPTLPGIQSDQAYTLAFLDRVQQWGIMPVDRVILQGKDLIKSQVERRLKAFKLTDDDVLLVLISSPGGMDGGRPYFQTWDNEHFLYKEILDLIKPLKSRLKLLFIDNSSRFLSDWGPVIRYFAPSQDIKAAYKRLFMDEAGLVFISSATEGELSWSTPLGSFFINSLIADTLWQGPVYTWKGVYEQSRDYCQQQFYRLWFSSLFSQGEKQDLKIQGILGQHLRSWSLSRPLTSLPVTLEPENFPTVTSICTIENRCDNPVILIWNKNNLDDIREHDETLVKVITIKPGKMIQFKNTGTVFNIRIAGQNKFYQLLPGRYIVDLDRRMQTILTTWNQPGQQDVHPIQGNWHWIELTEPSVLGARIFQMQISSHGLINAWDINTNLVFTGLSELVKNSLGEPFFDWSLLKNKTTNSLKVSFEKLDPDFNRFILTEMNNRKKDPPLVLYLLRENSYSIPSSMGKNRHFKGVNVHLKLPGMELQNGTKFRDYQGHRILTGIKLDYDDIIYSMQPMYREIFPDGKMGTNVEGLIIGQSHNTSQEITKENWIIAGFRLHRTIWNGREAVSHVEIIWQKWDKGPRNIFEISRYYGNTPLWDDTWQEIRLPGGMVSVGMWGRSSDIVNTFSLIGCNWR